jgi:hypothetical protein
MATSMAEKEKVPAHAGQSTRLKWDSSAAAGLRECNASDLT